MHFYFGVVYVLAAINISIAYAAPGPASNQNGENNRLVAREVSKYGECQGDFRKLISTGEKYAEFKGLRASRHKKRYQALMHNWGLYDRQCFYQDGDNLEGGLNVEESAKFNEVRRRWRLDDKNPDPNGDKQYTLAIVPGRARCEHVWCIGDHARLKLCDFRSDLGPYRNSTWSERQLLGAQNILELEFWPDTDYGLRYVDPIPIASAEELVSQPKDMDTCCSSYYRRDTQQRTSDRLTGVIKRSAELHILIEGIEKAEGQCDPSKDLKGFI
ncbi:hypothetical protein TWF481_002284 [Arthrobotrys musiformis]|uniref:Uncharacterized protein n=1 Tax=Arthrobotrys musiformis TaxID=47236 RepID=A0AAV9VUU9_9PEZI